MDLYLHFLCMPLWHVQRKLYLYLRQTEGKFSVSNKYYRVMDKSKLNEPANGSQGVETKSDI
jgi:hypothetical protein